MNCRAVGEGAEGGVTAGAEAVVPDLHGGWGLIGQMGISSGDGGLTTVMGIISGDGGLAAVMWD